MVKRLKALLICGIAAMGVATLLSGCSFSLPDTSYTPPEKTPVVSAPTIMNDGVLTVGVNAQNAPLAGQPTNSTKTVGIDVDVAAALADYLGLKLEIVDVGSDPASALEDGKVDIVMGVNNSTSQKDFWLSEGYLSTGVALFAPEETTSAPATSTTDSIAAQLSSKSAWAVANAYKSAKVVTTDKLEDAFTLLADGEVAYVASDVVSGTYATHVSDSSAHAVALIQAANAYCVGVANDNFELQQYISEALSTLNSNGIIKLIESKWLGAPLDIDSLPVVEVVAKDDEDKEDKESDEEEDSEDSTLDEDDSNQSTSLPSDQVGSNAVTLAQSA